MMELVSVLTSFFEALTIHMYISDVGNPKRKNFVAVVAVLLLTAAIKLSNLFAGISMMNLVVIAISILGVSFIYINQPKKNILITLMIVLVFTITEVLTMFLIVWVSRISVEQATQVQNYIILGTLLSKLFAFAILKLLSLYHNKQQANNLKTSYWILFLVMLLTSSLAIYLLFMMQYEHNFSSKFSLVSVWCSFGLLLSTFFALYLYENLQNQSEVEKKNELMQQQINIQQKHIDDILINQRQLKRLKHDMVNHNISISTFFEKGDCKNGIEYMKKLEGQFFLSNTITDTGNPVLDGIINTKRSVAQSKDIEFNTTLQIPPDIPIEPVDICTIFGNAIDNCIEACMNVKDRKKEISVSLFYEKDALTCKIVNTAVKHSSKDFLFSTKPNAKNHGFGVENIKYALSKYDSVYEFEQSESEFSFIFVIYC